MSEERAASPALDDHVAMALVLLAIELVGEFSATSQEAKQVLDRLADRFLAFSDASTDAGLRQLLFAFADKLSRTE